MSAATARVLLDQLRALGITAPHLVADSRKVQPGDVFLAYPGGLADGRQFIDGAVAAGAAAIIAEAGAMPVQLGAGETAQGMDIARLEVVGLASLCGELAAQVHGRPAEKMWTVGITGTNGKTSCSQWIAQALSALGEKTGVIGTLGNGLYGALRESPNTTPDALVLQQELADLLAAGAQACAMEVSSIGIEEHRINGMHFDVAVFTNLTQDHLDYHGTMAAYAEAKHRLFMWPGLRFAVLNLDDPFGQKLLEALPDQVEAIAYTLDASVQPRRATRTLLCPQRLQSVGAGVGFVLDGVEFNVPVVGRFNVSNVLAVIGALLAKGHTLSDCARVMGQLVPPPGRMQTLGGQAQPLIVVDYAHTPDALEKALGVLADTARTRAGLLHCVFGCGGDRDPGKRPLMGAVAERLADTVLVTSDNPRSEAPQKIIDDIVAGMKRDTAADADRARAIAAVVERAAAPDVVLIAGKGHEPYQEIAGVRHPFSDLDVAAAALARWRASR